MDTHWRNWCILSIVHFMAFPETSTGEGSIAETVEKIAEDPFFNGIEIGWIKDPAERARTKAILDQSHINIGYAAYPSLLIQKLNLNSLDESERKVAVDQIKANIDEAAEMGASQVGFLSGKDPGDDDRAAALDALVKSTKEMCAYGQDKGIGMICETFDRDVDKACLIGPSDIAATYAARVKEFYSEFGLIYDMSHMPLLRENAEEALTILKDYLVHIHVGNAVTDPDTFGYGDLHPRFGWPGSANDVPELVEFIKALFKIGYLAEGKDPRPWVGFEVKPQTEDETSELIIASTKRTWEQAWSQV